MEHMLLQPYASHPDSWSTYVDYAGDSHMATHHVDVEPQNYQHQQYARFHQQNYVIAQNDVQHPPLATPGASMSSWPTAQVPTTTADPSVSTALSMEPTYYASCYDNQDLSSAHRHTARGDHFLHGLPSAGGGVTYGTTNLGYAEPDSLAAALPPPAPHPTIAHQTESGHDLLQWDSVVGSTLYEGGGAASTEFQTSDTSYTIRPYGGTYTTATAPQPHYTPEPAKVERQQTYMAASVPACDAQRQYVAPVPVPAPPVRSAKREAQSPDLPPRGKSPMGHLPYPEEIGAKAEGRCRGPSLHRAITQLPSPAPTRTRSPTPTLSPYLQTLTFITYPETEPRGHREGRNGGGGVGGNGGADSEELDEDDDEGGSPPRRGRRGKKEPKKDPFLACFFCRGRKIACHPRHEVGGDRTCTQCAKRHLRCQYPLTSRRGQRKPREPAAGDCDGGAAQWGSPASNSPTPPSTRTNSKPRARASSRLPTSSSLVRAA